MDKPGDTLAGRADGSVQYLLRFGPVGILQRMTERPARKDNRIVAVYRGDDLVFHGPVDKAAKRLGINPKTIRYYLTPTYRERYAEYKRPERARWVELVDED